MMQMNDGRLLRFRLLNCTYKKSTIYAQQISLCTAYKKTFLTHFILHFGACTPFLAELGWQAVRQCPVESPAVHHHHHHHHHQCTTVFSIRVLIAHWKEGKQFSIKTSAATAILSENEHSLPFSSPFPPSLHFSLDDQRLWQRARVRKWGWRLKSAAGREQSAPRTTASAPATAAFTRVIPNCALAIRVLIRGCCCCCCW